ncbi:hypothetical protein Tco_0153055 [Tanacetum coccineum]
MENLNLFYQDIGLSSSAERHLTQEKATKEKLAIRISQRYALLEEERLVELDGKTMKEDEEAVKRIKGEALKEKDDPGAFIFPIRLEGKAKAMGKLSNVLCQVGVTTIIAKFLILDIPIDLDALIVVGWGFLHMMGSILNTSERIFSTFDGICHQTFRAARFDVLRTDEEEYDVTEMQSLEIDDMLRIRVREAESKEEFDEVCADDELQSKKIIKFRLGGRAHSLTLLEFAQRLGLYQAVELEEDGFNVYFKGDLRNDDNFNAQDYWLSISREDAIERMEYRQSYHWDRYHGVFEHMDGVYSVPMQGAYNLPSYAQPQYDQYYHQYPPLLPQQQQDDDE